MRIDTAHMICFSPANHTREVCNSLIEQLHHPHQMLTITAYHQSVEIEYSAQDLVIFAAPSFGGRVPVPAMEKYKKIKGKHTPCVLITTYGNRDYDDTLLELKDMAEAQGFIPIAAAAIVCEHSIMPQYGKDRPSVADKQKLMNFITKLETKIQAANEATLISIQVPGKHPYKEYHGIPLKPKASSACMECGRCAKECPVHAIDEQHPSNTDKDSCISCMRCITICPVHARSLNPIMLKASAKMLKKACETPKENQFFF